jgi:salicylate hydroxylase
MRGEGQGGLRNSVAATRTIAIAGSGIGGLTAALALAARGFRVVILERTERLEEAGAGLQLSPNASRILIGLGLEPRLAPRVLAPDSISIRTARTGDETGRIPLGAAAAARYGAPYWIVHRADLQGALAARVTDHPDIALRLGAQVEDVGVDADGVTVVHRIGRTRHEVRARALIGADGVWSTVRRHVAPAVTPSFTGRIAWRGTVDVKRLPGDAGTARVQLWMGPNAHLVAYPVSGGARINLVAVVTGTWNKPGWSEPGDATEVAAHFDAARWPAAARAMIGAVDSWRKWALFAMPDGGVWHNGRIALVGDAAHAMLPFVAQGAGMAIEDAAVIAACLADTPDDPAAAFAAYVRERAPRVRRVQRAARDSGRIYHLTGPLGLARDRVIGMLGGARLLARHNWIYEWRQP